MPLWYVLVLNRIEQFSLQNKNDLETTTAVLSGPLTKKKCKASLCRAHPETTWRKKRSPSYAFQQPKTKGDHRSNDKQVFGQSINVCVLQCVLQETIRSDITEHVNATANNCRLWA